MRNINMPASNYHDKPPHNGQVTVTDNTLAVAETTGTSRKMLHIVIVLGLLGVITTGCNQHPSEQSTASWPHQPIQISCFAAAGGGTDMISRMVAKLMEPELGARINVVNRPGGRGGAALAHVWSRERDGYNWGGFSESVLPSAVLGIHETTAKDWTFFMVAGAPAVLSVGPNSRYQTAHEFIKAARSRPTTIKVAASSMGSLWHTKLLALESAAGVRFAFIPFNQGSQPSQIAALTGEVDAVLTSISEQAELIKGGKLRPLAMVEAEAYDFPGMGRIPALGDNYPALRDLPIYQWLGFALPADTPEEVLARITAAFETVMKSDELLTLLEQQQLRAYGYHGAAANERALRAERIWTWMLHDLGVTVKSPAEFGIQKP